MDTLSESRVALVKKWADKYGLDPALVCAVCEQESGWDTFAIRYEPLFYEHYIVGLKIADATEAMARATSWGFMQVMGQVAREMGFTQRFLSQLCDAEYGLDLGCKVLKRNIDLANGDVARGLMHYNGGGDSYYPHSVAAKMEKYQ